MKIMVTGSSGLVGSRLVSFLSENAHSVFCLVRTSENKRSNGIYWNPAQGKLQANLLEGLDAVVHLAGENISDGRWSTAKKARILNSRIRSTQLLCKTLATLKQPPHTLISASAMGYYGHREEEVLEENSLAGTGFLAEVTKQWETATTAARQAGIRVVLLRFGMILSTDGGALKKMLTPFRWGLGGRIGEGGQYISWVMLEDVMSVITHALQTKRLQGPLNVCAPYPVTNLEFTKSLGRVLTRPTIFPIPSSLLRLALGEMANELLLASIRMQPKRLLESGYHFQYPHLEAALNKLLNNSEPLD
jgi:uncharacterized protein (TIGR01777 family)